jgi:tetratricopeptide (TPR) repeat protein
LYIPSGNIILLAFVLAGAAFGFLWRQGQSAHAADADLHSPLAHITALVLVIALTALVAWAAVTSTRRLVAEAFVGRGSVALQAGNTVQARLEAARALHVEHTGDTLRFAANAGGSKLASLASDTTTAPADLQQEFSTVLQETLGFVQEAIAKNPRDYRPTLLVAGVYDFLAGLKVQGALEQARAAYTAAATQNPTNPQIPLLRSRLEATAGNGQEVQKQITQALTLKPNYTDAMLFVAQLAVANNDLNTAVQASQAAVQSAPGVPSLWFQLGLLLYTGRDTKNAVLVLEKAVALVPDYANAKYFLGLSYWAENRRDEGNKQFSDLLSTNPGNAEIKLILSNMRAGKKDPFEGAEPPADTPPQKRTTAPVAQ